MTRFLFLIVLLFPGMSCFTQQNKNDTVFYQELLPKDALIETFSPAEFPGGKDALIDYIMRNIKYPLNAVKYGIEGKVIIRFSISEKGSTDDVYFLKRLNPEIDTLCADAIFKMPQWKPGTQLTNSEKGWYWKPIKTWWAINLNFSLTLNSNLKGIVITPG